jgi:hypothetical protein
VKKQDAIQIEVSKMISLGIEDDEKILRMFGQAMQLFHL